MNRTKKFKEEFVMKGTRKFILACLVLVMMAAVFGAGSAEAEIKVTFVNKTDRTVSVATGVEDAALGTTGWYIIQPGKSRTVTVANRSAGLTEYEMFGYYAMGKKKGAKTVYWRGDWREGYIHPTKSFEDVYDGGDGFQTVRFRLISTGGWKINGDNATKTVNLSM
jgi:uncharacterized membrane protein